MSQSAQMVADHYKKRALGDAILTALKAAEKLVRVAAKKMGARRVSSAGGIAKLSIVGTGMLGMPGIAARMFRALAEAGINIEMISTSEIRITCLVSRDQVEKGVRTLHKAFELDQA